MFKGALKSPFNIKKMKKNNKTCIVCGNKYTYCPSCAEFSHLPSWYGIFDSENCKNIFNAASDYLAGLITVEQATSILKDCDLSLKDNFSAGVVKALEELNLNQVVSETTTKKVVKRRTTKNKAEAE